MFITPTYNFIEKRHFQMGLGCLFSCLKSEKEKADENHRKENF